MQTPILVDHPKHWTMYVDGSLNINDVGASIYFISPSRDKLRYILRIHFWASNNATEFETALHGLHIAVELNFKCLMVYGDSALVINQLNKDWSCTSEKMDAYCAQMRKLEANSMVLNTIMWFRLTIKQPMSYRS
jgi:ribonuclease HI